VSSHTGYREDTRYQRQKRIGKPTSGSACAVSLGLASTSPATTSAQPVVLVGVKRGQPQSDQVQAQTHCSTIFAVRASTALRPPEACAQEQGTYWHQSG
jgi:hypothetical protein